MKVFFERRTELAPGIWQYFFKPERPVDFIPGQYASLQLLNVTNDPRGGSRTFSFTSLPAEPLISFVLKHFELQTPYKHCLQALQVGDEARLGDAMGDLVLPKNPDTPLVFVAGGIGIASFVGMLQELLAVQEERQVFLFYGLRSRREQIFREITSVYPLALSSVAISPNRITAQEVVDSTPPDALVYLSGSQRFVEDLRSDLGALGTQHERIIFDYFDGYTEL
ncbi:MAG TPA: FAD-dependent oxidoreductase [Candidatus Saccharimonadia bacterium]|nr:FAD-dependent oxidoreductase [Candidatus Saccharimonadia bacterium]